MTPERIVIISPTGRRWTLRGARTFMRRDDSAPLGWWPWVETADGKRFSVPPRFRFRQEGEGK